MKNKIDDSKEGVLKRFMQEFFPFSQFKKDRDQYWYKELKSHIESTHASQHKTILITGPHFYQVVTKVNILVIKLWLEHINLLRKERRQEPLKISWLTLQKKYRRDTENELR